MTPRSATSTDSLRGLLDRGREILRRLGDVRTADQALDSEHPAQARDALRELQALAGEYGELREAQAMLVGDAAGWSRDRSWTPTWTEQLAVVAEHGTIANPEIGKPPAAMFEQLVWLLDKNPAPVAFVPGFRELRRRADAAHPAPPPRPAEQGPPLTNAAGEGERRLARLRAQAGAPPMGA